MFEIMIAVFVLGYLAIALEHPLKIEKTAPALLIGSLLWVLYILDAHNLLNMGISQSWNNFIAQNPHENTLTGMRHFIVHSELLHHLGEIAEILFFLMGAMTIVEIVDQHSGFQVITNKIQTTNKVKLLWILGFITFFLSAALDNLTTTIVMIALLRKLIDDKATRWFYASIIVIAANAGGAWSPIGDVTTIMLWIGGQITTLQIMLKVFLPSLACLAVPLLALSFILKGNVTRPQADDTKAVLTTQNEQFITLFLGVGGLLFVPVFKTITHLPPYLGMLFSLSIIWIATEIMHRHKSQQIKDKLRPMVILKKKIPQTIPFFLGFYLLFQPLQSTGHLFLLAQGLDHALGNVFLIDLAIGVLSAIVDNVPLVAGAMGMYPVATPEMVQAAADPVYLQNFVQDGIFWEFLAYTAGTGGSMLIIGSAAGVAAMGLEKIDFIWYLKHISWLAALGYFAGALVYFLQASLLH